MRILQGGMLEPVENEKQNQKVGTIFIKVLVILVMHVQFNNASPFYSMLSSGSCSATVPVTYIRCLD